MILAWRLIGVRLAFAKARRGATIDWIGSTTSVIDASTVKATIMKERIDEVVHLTKELAKVSNVDSPEVLWWSSFEMEEVISLATIEITSSPSTTLSKLWTHHTKPKNESTLLSKVNVVSIKDLRSYTGKIQSMASLLFTWRPFVAMLWAALFSPAACSKAPSGCIWTAQIKEPVAWFLCFFKTNGTGNIVRFFHVDAHFNRGRKVQQHNLIM